MSALAKSETASQLVGVETAVSFKLERHEILSELQAHRPQWMDLKSRHERAGGFDGSLATEYGRSNDRINTLLEKLHECTVMSRLIGEEVGI